MIHWSRAFAWIYSRLKMVSLFLAILLCIFMLKYCFSFRIFPQKVKFFALRIFRYNFFSYPRIMSCFWTWKHEGCFVCFWTVAKFECLKVNYFLIFLTFCFLFIILHMVFWWTSSMTHFIFAKTKFKFKVLHSILLANCTSKSFRWFELSL